MREPANGTSEAGVSGQSGGCSGPSGCFSGGRLWATRSSQGPPRGRLEMLGSRGKGHLRPISDAIRCLGTEDSNCPGTTPARTNRDAPSGEPVEDQWRPRPAWIAPGAPAPDSPPSCTPAASSFAYGMAQSSPSQPLQGCLAPRAPAQSIIKHDDSRLTVPWHSLLLSSPRSVPTLYPPLPDLTSHLFFFLLQLPSLSLISSLHSLALVPACLRTSVFLQLFFVPSTTALDLRPRSQQP